MLGVKFSTIFWGFLACVAAENAVDVNSDDDDGGDGGDGGKNR